MNIIVAETKEEIDHAYQVRMKVFVEEQKVPTEEEIDEHDKTAIHFVGYEAETPIAASRLRFADNYGKLERICILKEHRGKHYGQQIIHAMEEKIMANGYKKAKLHAQTHAEGFYGKLGYQTVSGEFMDAGIPHVAMTKEL
ncbi:GNAT family N-acetyltransferase [Virgibacillus kimchii]